MSAISVARHHYSVSNNYKQALRENNTGGLEMGEICDKFEGPLGKHSAEREGKLLCGDCAGTTPDWTSKCDVCGQSPVLPMTGMCGPCTFGDASTLNGNW